LYSALEFCVYKRLSADTELGVSLKCDPEKPRRYKIRVGVKKTIRDGLEVRSKISDTFKLCTSVKYQIEDRASFVLSSKVPQTHPIYNLC